MGLHAAIIQQPVPAHLYFFSSRSTHLSSNILYAAVREQAQATLPAAICFGRLQTEGTTRSLYPVAEVLSNRQARHT